MIIQKKRIRNVQKYLDTLSELMIDEFYVRVPNSVNHYKKLKNINYGDLIGESMIPTPVGPITEFNANGKEIIRKDLPKETKWFSRDYHVVDWHGRDHYGTCSVPRECFPRDLSLPPEEVIIFTTEFIRSMPLEINDLDRCKHVINMFLELFGFCELAALGTSNIPNIVNKRVPWKILPPGEYPWDRIKSELETTRNIKSKHRSLKDEIETLLSYKPDLFAIGMDNFNGYIVFGYSRKNIFILESTELNNATYIFKNTWENMSQLSKKEILDEGLHYDRIVHSQQWKKRIKHLFK